MQYTEYSYLTDEEVISKVEMKEDASSLEVELAMRLNDSLDLCEEADEVIEELFEILDDNGITIEFVEDPLQ